MSQRQICSCDLCKQDKERKELAMVMIHVGAVGSSIHISSYNSVTGTTRSLSLDICAECAKGIIPIWRHEGGKAVKTEDPDKVVLERLADVMLTRMEPVISEIATEAAINEVRKR